GSAVSASTSLRPAAGLNNIATATARLSSTTGEGISSASLHCSAPAGVWCLRGRRTRLENALAGKSEAQPPRDATPLRLRRKAHFAEPIHLFAGAEIFKLEHLSDFNLAVLVVRIWESFCSFNRLFPRLHLNVCVAWGLLVW